MGKPKRDVATLGRRGRAELVPTEKNIEESYLFAGGANDAKEIREYVIPVTLEDGTSAMRRFKYTPSEEYGDTTDFDRDVYRALILLAHRKGGMPDDGVVFFSLYEVRNILELPDNGTSYRKIRDSIIRLQKLLVDADVYRKTLRGFKSEYYTVWRVNFEANEDKYGRAVEHHWVRFDDVVVRSYKEGYVRDLDHDFYFSLSKKHARGLYSEIDLGRGNGLVWEVPLANLKARLGMAASYRSPSAQKRALEPAHEEMRRKGFLARVSCPDKYTIRYEVAEQFVVERTFLERSWTREEEQTIRTLIRNEVWPVQARELVAEKGTVLCNYYIRALPYQKWVREPGAFLYKYIKNEKPLSVEPPQMYLEEAGVVPDGKAGPSYADVADRGGPREGGGDFPRRQAASPSSEPSESDPNAQELFDGLLTDVGDDIDVSSLRVWFDGIVATAFRGGTLTIEVPNSFAKEYIESRFGTLLKGALSSRVGEDARLEVVARTGAG